VRIPGVLTRTELNYCRKQERLNDRKVTKLPQYSVTFLAGSFGLTEDQARAILAQCGDDRVKAAEAARVQKRAST